MAERNKSLRILSVDVRSAKFGFVVLEGPDALLDFGVRAYPRQRGPVLATANRSFLKLMDLYVPSLTVFRLLPAGPDGRIQRATIVAKALQRSAKRRSIPVRCLSREAVKKFFQGRGFTTKYSIASYLADRLRGISWIVPAKRKAWEPESYGMCIFDAAAAGWTHFRRPLPNQQSKFPP